MRLADAESVASMNGAVPSGDGAAGSGESATDNGGPTRASKRRESDLELVDTSAAARIKKAESAEEIRKKDAAFLQRYDDRVKEVRGAYLVACPKRCTCRTALGSTVSHYDNLCT